MADYGFGHGDFGQGPFGRPDIAKDALWERTVPQRNKNDDALVARDFERWQEVVGEFVDGLINRAVEFPRQGDPVTVLSAQENQKTLTVVSSSFVSSGTVRVVLDEGDREDVEGLWAQSVDTSGVVDRVRNDGWVAVIGDRDYKIIRVRAYDDDEDGAPTIDVKTLVAIPSTLTVEPPDLLSRLGSNVSIFVDKADPPDYSRRAIFRHRLIRDLKVSARLFEMLGRIYGFDVTVTGLYCISQGFYDGIRASSPQNAWLYDGKYYTDIPYSRQVFDQIPLDVIPLDTVGDYDISTFVGSSVQQGTSNTWCVTLTPGATSVILGLGNWVLVDANGVEYWIESLSDQSVVDEQSTTLTDGTVGPFLVQSEQWPITESTLVVKWNDSGSVQRTVTDDGAGNLTGDGTGTVNYQSGEITLTAGAITEVGGDILLDYDVTRVCVGSLAPLASGTGALRLKPRTICVDNYKRAAAYRFEIAPDEVITEPGADFVGIVDRIEEKIDSYIPIHIRLVQKIFKFQATLAPWLSGWPQLSVEDQITDDPIVNAIGGILFDQTELDVQNLDVGTFQLTVTLTLT